MWTNGGVREYTVSPFHRAKYRSNSGFSSLVNDVSLGLIRI